MFIMVLDGSHFRLNRPGQLPKDKIYTAFADPTLADAICDPRFRPAIGITLKGEYCR